MRRREQVSFWRTAWDGVGLPLRLNNGRRWNVAPEDLPDWLILDEGELNAEADDDTEHKSHDEEFE